MYLNTGNGRHIREKRIVGIFDMDTATVCVATRQFLSRAQKEGRVADSDGDIPKSFILCQKEDKKQKKARKEKGEKSSEVILCKFSSGVLFGRIGNEQALTASVEESGEDIT